MGEFLVVIQKSNYGYDASCPTLQGCHSQGDTEEEAIENIRDAIREYLAALKQIKRQDNMLRIQVSVQPQ